ncbi:Fic family protein [Peptococcus simiae]|uniref:Fic family protein n=1 Tax=Peptococcus simiae TaxID=1643805 RepID=UPI00398144AA
MAYMSVKQAAEKWQIDEDLVVEFCQDGSLVGVVKEGRTFFIPEEAICPVIPPNLEARPSSPEYEELIGRIDEKNEARKACEVKNPEKMAAFEKDFKTSFVYECGAISGNPLSRDEVATILEGQVVAGQPLRAHLQVVGLSDAYDHMKDLVDKRVPLSEKIIKDLHGLIMVDKPAERGKYRLESIHVLGAYHQPPEADRVPAKMAKQLGKFINPQLHAVESAVLFLMKFDGIRPFMDANGRVGRLLLNFMLLQQGYPAVSISPKDRDAFYAAIDTYYRDQTSAPMVELIAQYMEQQLDDYKAACQA